MKEFSIDTFPNHTKYYFDTLEDAEKFGQEQVEKGKIVFLLRHRLDGFYEVEKEITKISERS